MREMLHELVDELNEQQIKGVYHLIRGILGRKS